jgi:glutathione peroxidase
MSNAKRRRCAAQTERTGSCAVSVLIRGYSPLISMKTRTFLAIAAAAMLAPVIAKEDAKSELQAIPLKDIDGKATSLKAYDGKVLLVVNVASNCGYTKQYTGLEALHQKYAAKGFSVLGFPCNDFGGQEPGTAEEIKKFCSTKYSVTFPLFEKLHVKGDEQHPLYAALTGKSSPVPGDVKWNFGKFLISKDGKILKRWDSKTAPDDKELIAAIEEAMAAK